MQNTYKKKTCCIKDYTDNQLYGLNASLWCLLLTDIGLQNKSLSKPMILVSTDLAIIQRYFFDFMF